MKRIIALGILGTALFSCTTPSTELEGVSNGIAYSPTTPYGMIKVEGGAYTMGANDQNVPYAQTTPVKTVTMHSFWMDHTEITNNEYRQFVNWVRDSIAREYLAENGVESHEKIEEGPDGEFLENPRLDWSTPIDWNSDDEIYSEALDAMYLSEDERVFGKKQLDPRNWSYAYSKINSQILGQQRNQYDTKSESYREGFSRQNLVEEFSVNVYPDTNVWLKDFAYAYTFNEPIFSNYFWHPSYGEYPVVGVSWEQANAFCNWRTDLRLSGLTDDEKVFETAFRLPTEAEWEFAARGGKQQTIYPWGSLYPTTAKGCFLANFKPRRGEYGADGHVFTAPAVSFNPNDIDLFNMSGNVAEWTSTPFEQTQYSFWHDLNPDYQYSATDSDNAKMKRKVIKGGSWKDIGAFIQIAARDFEQQDNATSFIGFRCVKTYEHVREFDNN